MTLAREAKMQTALLVPDTVTNGRLRRMMAA